jgi:hypothetical protein
MSSPKKTMMTSRNGSMLGTGTKSLPSIVAARSHSSDTTAQTRTVSFTQRRRRCVSRLPPTSASRTARTALPPASARSVRRLTAPRSGWVT